MTDVSKWRFVFNILDWRETAYFVFPSVLRSSQTNAIHIPHVNCVFLFIGWDRISRCIQSYMLLELSIILFTWAAFSLCLDVNEIGRSSSENFVHRLAKKWPKYCGGKQCKMENFCMKIYLRGSKSLRAHLIYKIKCWRMIDLHVLFFLMLKTW